MRIMMRRDSMIFSFKNHGIGNALGGAFFIEIKDFYEKEY